MLVAVATITKMKKKNKPSKKVSIEFDEKHLGTLATALEVYSRLRSGQIKMAMDTAFWDKDLTYQDGEVLESMVRTIVFHKESIPRTRMGIKIEISSMEDEWFKVITTNIDLKVSVSSREPSYHSVDQKYYLCDQFDGLLKLLSVI
jgi:hypothetical protein